MEIQRANLSQVRAGRGGRLEEIRVGDDVLDIARQLQEVSPALRLRFNERGGYFVVYEIAKDGSEKLVTTCQELDQRLVEHVRRIGSAGWRVGAEMDRAEEDRKRREDHEWRERVGPLAERLAFAVRKDLEAKNKIFVPGGRA